MIIWLFRGVCVMFSSTGKSVEKRGIIIHYCNTVIITVALLRALEARLPHLKLLIVIGDLSS